MALPCIFLLLCADFQTEHEENIINLYPALKYCSGQPDEYNVFGHPWPIVIMLSLASLAN